MYQEAWDFIVTTACRAFSSILEDCQKMNTTTRYSLRPVLPAPSVWKSAIHLEKESQTALLKQPAGADYVHLPFAPVEAVRSNNPQRNATSTSAARKRRRPRSGWERDYSGTIGADKASINAPNAPKPSGYSIATKARSQKQGNWRQAQLQQQEAFFERSAAPLAKETQATGKSDCQSSSATSKHHVTEELYRNCPMKRGFTTKRNASVKQANVQLQIEQG